MSDDTINVDEEGMPDLSELDYEELSALEEALIEEFEERSATQEFSDEGMDGLRDVVAALDIVRDEAAKRAEFALMSEIVDATRVGDFVESFAAEDEDETEVSFLEEDEEIVVAENLPESVEEEITAAIKPDGIISKVNTVPATARKSNITASADVPGYAAGQQLDGLVEVAEALMAKRGHIRGTDVGNDGYQYLVASMQTAEYTDDRVLGNDAIVNFNRVQAATNSMDAIVAGGGINVPLTPYYEITTYGDSVRPVRDALVGFRADRGGIRYVPSPKIADTATGVNVYAETVDASATPYGAGKGSVTLSVGSETTVKVDVVPRIMKIGNLNARTFPEMVAAWTRLLIAQHAREAEQNLLDKITSGSTAVSAAATYGATRSLLPQIDQLVASFRSRNRVAATQQFRAIIPFWVKDLIRTDLSRQTYDANFGINDAQIDAYFAARGVNCTWTLDTGSTTNMVWGTQSTGGMLKYPTIVEWFLFPEGSWLFLDGGSLDLGLVRDSTLNSTNDYMLFAETFESAAFVGVESLKIKSTVYADGTGPALATATY
jgi:hypothetical protein